jgi:hypothetical protein
MYIGVHSFLLHTHLHSHTYTYIHTYVHTYIHVFRLKKIERYPVYVLGNKVMQSRLSDAEVSVWWCFLVSVCVSVCIFLNALSITLFPSQIVQICGGVRGLAREALQHVVSEPGMCKSVCTWKCSVFVISLQRVSVYIYIYTYTHTHTHTPLRLDPR